MIDANIRDAVAVIDTAAKVEDGMANGEDWDEAKVMNVLEQARREQKNFRGLSFHTISAYGENGAVIHYKSNNVTNSKLGTDSLFLLDSGKV